MLPFDVWEKLSEDNKSKGEVLYSCITSLLTVFCSMPHKHNFKRKKTESVCFRRYWKNLVNSFSSTSSNFSLEESGLNDWVTLGSHTLSCLWRKYIVYFTTRYGSGFWGKKISSPAFSSYCSSGNFPSCVHAFLLILLVYSTHVLHFYMQFNLRSRHCIIYTWLESLYHASWRRMMTRKSILFCNAREKFLTQT